MAQATARASPAARPRRFGARRLGRAWRWPQGAEAAKAARRGAEANPRFALAFALHAAALVRLGRVEEAKAAAQRALAIDPGFRLDRLAQLGPGQDAFGPFVAALREAGLPI